MARRVVIQFEVSMVKLCAQQEYLFFKYPGGRLSMSPSGSRKIYLVRKDSGVRLKT